MFFYLIDLVRPYQNRIDSHYFRHCMHFLSLGQNEYVSVLNRFCCIYIALLISLHGADSPFKSHNYAPLSMSAGDVDIESRTQMKSDGYFYGT